MATLDDLQTTKSTSIDDLQISKDTAPAAKPNRSSTVNVAAHAAMLDPSGEVEARYNETLAQMEDNPTKGAVDNIFNAVRQGQYSQASGALTDLLVDQSVGDDVKAEAAAGIVDITSEIYNFHNTLSNEAIIADNGVDEDFEVETTRINFGETLLEYNGYRQEKQALLNSAAAAGDTNMLNIFGDIVEYFTPFVESTFAQEVVDDLREGKPSAYNDAFLLLGNSKKEVRDMVASLDPKDRLDFSRLVIRTVEENDNITLFNENDFASLDFLRTFLEDGHYTDADSWIDNAVSILDMTIIGGPLARAAKGGVQALSAVGAVSRITAARDAFRRSVVSRVQPASPSQNLKDTNPAKAREAHEAAAMDETGEIAEGMYGTTREDAVSSDLLPQVGTETSEVVAKVNNIDRIHNVTGSTTAEIEGYARTSGHIELTQAEKASARASVVNDFEQAMGVTARKEMFQVDALESGVGIKAVYGPSGSGFTDANQALDTAEFALRNYGVQKKDIQLLVRENGSYVPTDLKDIQGRLEIEKVLVPVGKKTGPKQRQKQLLVTRKPDYLIQVNHQYDFNPADVTEWAKFDVKYNIFDRLAVGIGKLGAGSLQRNVLDPASMLDPTITLSANRAFDKAAKLEKDLLSLGNEFAQDFIKMPHDRKAIMDDFIREANSKSQPYSFNKMMAEGFTEAEVTTYKKWRDYWDTAFLLENRDLAKTLNAQGYKELIDHGSDSKLFGKPLHVSRAPARATVYDIGTGTSKQLTPSEVSELYKNGGNLVQLRSPVVIGDEALELVVAKNVPGDNYLRGITADTEVLNYRHGYYSVNYKDPQFIVQNVKDSNGNLLYQKAVDTAGSVSAAKLKRDRLSKGGGEYIVRSDVKGIKNDSDLHWDLQQARGRTSQRVRGKRLEDSTTNVTDLERQAPILGPVDSMVLSARSIGNRVPLRNVIETDKARFVDQYGEFLDKGKFGDLVWPSNVKDVKYRNIGDEDRKKLGAARTTFEYINYIENGYINHLDDGIKSVLKGLGYLAGGKGLSGVETFLVNSTKGRGVSALAKNAVFTAYLGTNPARQFIIQSHQAVQLAANFPTWAGKAAGRDLLVLTTGQVLGKTPDSILTAVGMTRKEGDDLMKQWIDTGLAASIDKQNLVRGAISDMADEVAKKGVPLVTPSLVFLRKIGFDSGEYINLMTAWSAHRHKAIKNGEDMSNLAVADNVAAKARNYTYNMNPAGDMPYNQNALAMFFQFMQVPHKAFTTMTTNRVLNRKEKQRLFLFNSLMYGLPPAAVLSLTGHWLPDETVEMPITGLPARDLMLNGMEGAMLNKLLNLATEEDTYLDWSGLAPTDFHGPLDLLHGFWTEGVGTMLTETPFGSLFLKEDGKFMTLMRTTARFTNFKDDYEKPTTFTNVVHDFFNLSSGYSNAYKSLYMDKYRLKRSSYGGIIDPEVSKTESTMQLFGFPTMDSTERRFIKQELYEKSKAFKDDIAAWHRDTKRHLLKDGLTPESVDGISQMQSEFWRVHGNDNAAAKRELDRLMSKDLTGSADLYQRILKAHDIIPIDDLKGLINSVPDMSREQKDSGIEQLEFIKSYKIDYKED